MYPLTCHAGFNVPARAGKFEIVGFTAVGDVDLEADQEIELAIIDDSTIDQAGKAGKIYASLDTNQKNILVHKKIVFDTDSNYDATLEWFPPEPIKTRYGTSLYFNNIKQGSLCLYVR
jgi:hypothetical protein